MDKKIASTWATKLDHAVAQIGEVLDQVEAENQVNATASTLDLADRLRAANGWTANAAVIAAAMAL